MNRYVGTLNGTELPAGISKRRLEGLCSTHILEDVDFDCDVDFHMDEGQNSDVLQDESADGWLQKIIEKVPLSNERADKDLIENAFFCAYDKHEVQKFVRLLEDLPLWSNIMVEIFGSEYTTATSQDVESNFKTLKHHVLDQKMVRPDKFFLAHEKYLKTEVKLLIAK